MPIDTPKGAAMLSRGFLFGSDNSLFNPAAFPVGVRKTPCFVAGNLAAQPAKSLVNNKEIRPGSAPDGKNSLPQGISVRRNA